MLDEAQLIGDPDVEMLEGSFQGKLKTQYYGKQSSAKEVMNYILYG